MEIENINNNNLNININIDLEIDNNKDYDNSNREVNLEWTTSDLNYDQQLYNNITFLDMNEDEEENHKKINDEFDELDEINDDVLNKYLNQPQYQNQRNSPDSLFNSDNNLEYENNLDEVEEEIETDLKLVKILIDEQNKIRLTFFKKILMNYIKPYKYIDHGVLKNNIINGIKNIASNLSIENYVAQQIASILFDYKILENDQILKNKNIFKPFLNSKEDQFNFLNYILVILNKFNHLIEPDSIITIFEQIINFELVNDNNFIKWYNKKLNSRMVSKLNIKQSVIDAVYNFLDEFIINIQMNQ